MGARTSMLNKIRGTLAMAVAVIAAFCFVRCSKDVVCQKEDSGIPISFGTYAGRLALRASDTYFVGGPVIPAGTSFGVFAYYHNNSTFDEDMVAGICTPRFMFNQKVTNSGTPEVPEYTYSPVKYWPAEDAVRNNGGRGTDRLSFVGYYPDCESSGLTVETTGSDSSLPVFLFTVNDDPSKQVDFLLSDLEKDLTRQSVSSKVELKFRHMLSQVQFNVVANDDRFSVRVDSIRLDHVYNNAVMNVGRTAAGSVWEVNRLSLAFHSISSGQVLLELPQTLSEEVETEGVHFVKRTRVRLKYTMTDNSRENWSITQMFEKDMSTEEVPEWRPGCRYVYNILVSPDEIIFSADLANWLNSNTSITVE